MATTWTSMRRGSRRWFLGLPDRTRSRYHRPVTDPLSTSKAARESLSRGLNALQADPSVPPALVELAAPIAQAMGALHQIERTQQLAPHADLALNNIRGALAQLQAAQTSHPAVTNALDAVATALSLVHQLSRAANGPQGGNTAQPPGPLPPPQQQPPPPRATTEAIPQKAPPQASGSQPQMAPNPFPPPAQPNFTAPQPQRPSMQQPPPPQQQAYAPPPQQAYGPPNQPPMVSRDPFAAPSNPAFAGPPPQPHMASGPQIMAPASPSIPVPAPPVQGGAQLVNAEFGAHSATNFFKGLSGNDIIDHGGIFVSTYALPKIGHPVRIKVSLPGGYEFEANAVVKWTREEGGDDVPPGFGAKFTGITPEARQLVYRYVRNREPMFYDDL